MDGVGTVSNIVAMGGDGNNVCGMSSGWRIICWYCRDDDIGHGMGIN